MTVMCVKAIYNGFKMIYRLFRDNKLMFQCKPVTFHNIEDGKLIIYGAHTVISTPEGLYLDCEPEWVFPTQNGNALAIRQVYNATQNGSVLGVE